jgi:hypothetical protein
MGARTELLRLDLKQAAFTYDRNYETLPDTSLIYPTKNINYHEGGISKRGGTDIVVTPSVASRVMGGYDFRTPNAQYQVYAKKNGKVYRDDDSNELMTGMSTSNYFHFSQFDNTLYVCDGATLPKKWDITNPVASVTPATDWATFGYPMQIIYHTRGVNARNWAITPYAVFASKNNDGGDFGDATVRKIQIYSVGGLVGAYEFNGELFCFSRTEIFRINDEDHDSDNWGYDRLIYEGGAAHWRLITAAGNDLYIVGEDSHMFKLSAVFNSGDYEGTSLAKPAYIDRFLREIASIGTIEEWNMSYDRKLRALKLFVRTSTSAPDTALVYFIDRDPQIAWSLHDNLASPSGYNGSASWMVRKDVGDWRIRTGDASGRIWELESTTRDDNSVSYENRFKFKPWEFGNPVMWKYFRKIIARIRSVSNAMFVIRIWINGVRKPDVSLSVSGSGSQFDVSLFDDAVFADDVISFEPFDTKYYGYNIQVEFVNNTAGEDYICSELVIPYKEEGVRFDG